MGKPDWLDRLETERSQQREMDRHNTDKANRTTRTYDEHIAHVAERER